MTGHPRLESILGLDFNQHGKTLYYSILYPFCYTVGVSRLLQIEGFGYREKWTYFTPCFTQNRGRQGLNIYTKKQFQYSLLLKPFYHTSLRGLMVKALACHAGDPGSIPGVCLDFILFLSHLVSKKVEFKTFLNPFSLKVQRLYCFYYIHIRSQNPIEKSFVMFIEVTNLKWIRLGGEK